MMEKLTDCHFEYVDKCPWCGCASAKRLYSGKYRENAMECNSCGFIYADKVLNDIGLNIYWKNYESEVHMLSGELAKYRAKSYIIEARYVRPFINKMSFSVLDVGCAVGGYLDAYRELGATVCEGVEYGKEAYEQVCQKYKCYFGLFPKLEIMDTYDLITFRGTIQYFKNPKPYFEKAVQLLNPGGLLYISATIDFDSIVPKLFGGQFRLPVGVTDYYGYKEKLITEYLREYKMELINKSYPYIETPYANVEDDILLVAKAIQYKKEGKEIDFQSPPFWGNMISLIYKKSLIDM